MVAKNKKKSISLAHNLLAVDVEGTTIIDDMDRFKSINGTSVNILALYAQQSIKLLLYHC
jgi:hypothetical protein